VIGVLSHINILSILLAGVFYVLFSKLWFSDFVLGNFYHGVFREDLFTTRMKIRSSIVRLVAGALIGFVIDTIIIVTEISSVKAAAEMGLLISIVPSVVSVIQLFYLTKQGKRDNFSEMIFQALSIEAIGIIMVLM
jgi:hypothetical protein